MVERELHSKNQHQTQINKNKLKNGRHVIVLTEGHLVNLGVLLDTHRLSCLCLVQLALWTNPKKYHLGVHFLKKEKEHDEEVAQLHLDHLDEKNYKRKKNKDTCNYQIPTKDDIILVEPFEFQYQNAL